MSKFSKVKAIDLVNKKMPIVFINSTETTSMALTLLRDNNISSLLVLDKPNKKYLGFVDILDILSLVIFFAKDLSQLIDELSQSKVDWKLYLEQELKGFKECPVNEMVNASQRNEYCPVFEGAPFHSLVDMFSKNVDLHRVALVDGDGDVQSMITQSRFVEYVMENVSDIPEEVLNKQVKDLEKYPREVYRVKNTASAVDGFKDIIEKKVSGLAVVDENGKLVGCLSASDLKWSNEENVFKDLDLNVMDYLETSDNWYTDKSADPICVKKNSTVLDCLIKMNKYHIHRLFVIDDEKKPIGVISLCDLISVFQILPFEDK